MFISSWVTTGACGEEKSFEIVPVGCMVFSVTLMRSACINSDREGRFRRIILGGVLVLRVHWIVHCCHCVERLFNRLLTDL